MSYERVIKSLENLAPLSDVVLKIQDLFNQGHDTLDIHELIKLIETDAVLSVNILRIANSPLYGFSTRISSVSQAVTLFGIMQIYGFIMSYSVRENIPVNTAFYNLTNEKYNDICTLQSALLLEWYSKIDEIEARFLAPLALIMETGKLLIANEYLISKNKEELRLLDSYNISSEVFTHWHLELVYSKVLKDLHQDSISEKIQNARKIIEIIITSVNVDVVLSKDSVLKACSLVKNMGEDPNIFAAAALKIKKAYINECR